MSRRNNQQMGATRVRLSSLSPNVSRRRHRAVAKREPPVFELRRSAASSALCLSLVLSPSVALSATAQASTVVSIGATGSSPRNPVTALQRWPYTHNFADDPVTDVKTVDYPASLGFVGMPMGESVDRGSAGLAELIDSTPGTVIVVCESQGCLSVTRLLQRYAADPTTAAAADNLILVMVGNPATAGGGMSAQAAGSYHPLFRITFPGATPESQYRTFNVTREYDFYADQPLDASNGLAMLNSLIALFVVHPYYGDIDVDSPDNLVKIVGNTTYVLAPTKQLPLLGALYGVAATWSQLTGQTGLMQQVEALDAQLRAIIDGAYDRSGYETSALLRQGEVEHANAVIDDEVVSTAPKFLDDTLSTEALTAGGENRQPAAGGPLTQSANVLNEQTIVAPPADIVDSTNSEPQGETRSEHLTDHSFEELTQPVERDQESITPTRETVDAATSAGGAEPPSSNGSPSTSAPASVDSPSPSTSHSTTESSSNGTT